MKKQSAEIKDNRVYCSQCGNNVIKVNRNYKHRVVDNLDPVTVKFYDGTRDSFCMGRVLEISSHEYFNERCKNTIDK